MNKKFYTNNKNNNIIIIMTLSLEARKLENRSGSIYQET